VAVAGAFVDWDKIKRNGDVLKNRFVGCTCRLLAPCFQSTCYLILILMMPVALADREERLEEVLSQSCLAGIMATYPEQIRYQLHRPGAELDPEVVKMAEDRLLSAYRALDVMSVLNAYVIDRLRPAQLKAILDWYNSPLGRRLAAAEHATETAAGREEMETFLAEFDRQTVAETRVRLVRRFEQVARLSHINMAVIRALYETEFVAVNAVRPQQARFDDSQLRESMQRQFYELRDMILPGLAVNMMATSYYTLHAFTNDEIAEYIEFLESDAGRTLLRLYEDVPVYLFRQVVARAGMPVPEAFFHPSGGQE